MGFATRERPVFPVFHDPSTFGSSCLKADDEAHERHTVATSCGGMAVNAKNIEVSSSVV